MSKNKEKVANGVNMSSAGEQDLSMVPSTSSAGVAPPPEQENTPAPEVEHATEVNDEGGNAEENEESERTHQACLSRSEAIHELVYNNYTNIFMDWKTCDLAAFFCKMKNTNIFNTDLDVLSETFETSPEEILDMSTTLNSIVNESGYVRIPWRRLFNEPVEEEDTGLNQSQALQVLQQVAVNMSQKKKERFMRSDALTEVFTQCQKKRKLPEFSQNKSSAKKIKMSDNHLMKACEYAGEVNYDNIYKLLGSISSINTPARVNPIEAAIILKIFDQLQHFVDNSFNDHTKFLKTFLKDFAEMGVVDINPVEVPSVDDMGEVLWNFFCLPNDFMDLSGYVITETKHGAVLR